MKLFLALTLSLATALPALAETSPMNCHIDGRFRDIIVRTLGEDVALTQVSFGLEIIDRESGEVLCEESLNPDLAIYPASTIKTLVAASVLRKVDQGELSLTTRVPMTQVNAAEECSDWGCDRYGPGSTLTLRELLQDMLTVSNNLATNQLMDVAGKGFINDTADLFEASALRVFRKVYNRVDPEPDNKARNSATAAGHTALYRELATGHLGVLSESSRTTLLDILRGQKHNDRLNADFPADVFFFHKPGNTSRVTGDAGFFYLDKRRAVVLAGLQNFANLTICSDPPTLLNDWDDVLGDGMVDKTQGCSISGYMTLRRIGRASLELSRAL